MNPALTTASVWFSRGYVAEDPELCGRVVDVEVRVRVGKARNPGERVEDRKVARRGECGVHDGARELHPHARECVGQEVHTVRASAGAVREDMGRRVVRDGVLHGRHRRLEPVHLGARVRVVRVRSTEPTIEVVIAHRHDQHAIPLRKPSASSVVAQITVAGNGESEISEVLEGLLAVPRVLGLVARRVVDALIVVVADTATVKVDPQRRLAARIVARLDDEEGVVAREPRTRRPRSGRSRARRCFRGP